MPPPPSDPGRVRRVKSAGLTPAEVTTIRALLWEAFGPGDEGMTEDDWTHALGGDHFLLEVGGQIVAHASVVERDIRIGGRPVRTGYVEAVATATSHQGKGLGSQLMAAVSDFIRANFELGVLGTGRHDFYERLGWLTWLGPSSVRTADGERPTPDDDGYLLVLPTPASPPLDRGAPINCDERPGDDW